MNKSKTMLRAKPVLKDKFWLVEQDGVTCATLRKNEDNRFVLSNENGVVFFKNKKHIESEFGSEFFIPVDTTNDSKIDEHTVHGFSSSCKPFNTMYDLHRKIPLFTKSKDSKSLYCAGYYIIKFNKGWVKSFCPKLITIQRYPYNGPFKTELEMKQALSNANK